MKSIIAHTFASLFMLSIATNAQANSLQEKVTAAWLGEVKYFALMCKANNFPENWFEKIVDQAGLKISDIENGGSLYSPFLYANTFAHDKFAESSISDICFAFKSQIGQEGYLIQGDEYKFR